MGRSVCRNTTLGGVILAAALCALASATNDDDLDNEIKTEVEFKTQAPLDILPETAKDCYEYLYGKLTAIRRHGTTWQNGEADCSNCTCDNGDIRCFFHFCNGPSTGYMTPPTTDDEELDTTEESSGYPPPDLSMDTQETHTQYEGVEWPPDVLPEKWQNELSTFETSSRPSAGTAQKGENVLSLLKGKQQQPQKQDRTENETHNIFRTFFCEKTCKKLCPLGFKVDPSTGCWKCLCRGCPSHKSCDVACPHGMGRSWDENGCETCSCKTADEDIIFTDDDAEGVPEGNASASEESEPSASEEVDDEGWVFSKGSSSEDVQVEVTDVKGGEEASLQQEANEKVTSFPTLKEGISLLGDDEPCNKTQVRGCFDGSLKFSVGEQWSRGPCVSCQCMAPGYSECNITQCHIPRCKVALRYTPEEACCAICKDTPTPGLLEIPSHESHIFSAAPTEILPSRHAESELSLLQREGFLSEEEEEATIKSVPKDGDSHLLLILIPMGVLLGVCALLSAHFWRRYHRDKYDINSYRPEEKQKLRPVKTLNDDTSSLANVC